MRRLTASWILLGLWLLLACAGSTSAATVGERRQLQPGIWWDASHPGHGFEVQQINDQLFVLWYTYDDNGWPVWYAAQTGIGETGSASADLVRHHWKDGRIDRSVTVGTLQLEWSSRESAQAKWMVGGRSGEWSLKPFEVSGVLPEVNHSGLWYQPNLPGYGLSLMEQGSVLIAALFLYDDNGDPIWLFGSDNEGTRKPLLNQFRGHCPGCSPRLETTATSAVLNLALGAEGELQFGLQQARGIVARWQLEDVALSQLSPTFSQRAADWQLAQFESDAALKRWLEQANAQRQAYPIGQVEFSAAPPGRSFAPTNVQEEGVDEADLVKSDGRYVYTFGSNSVGSSLPQLRLAEVQSNGLRSIPPVPLKDLGNQGVLFNPGLYLTDQRLVVVASGYPTVNSSSTSSVWTDLYAWRGGRTDVQILDRSQPETPRSVFSATLEGYLLASRRIGDQLYLVHRAAVVLQDIYAPASDAEQLAHNREMFAATPLSQLLPQASWNGSPQQDLVSAGRTFLPPTGDAGLQPEFVMVTRINIQHPEQRETLTVLGRAAAVYVSSKHLYLASTRFQYLTGGFTGFTLPGFSKTDVHQIALENSGMRVVGTGTVEGYLDRDADRAPLRFSEREGRLNLVTVSPNMWGELGQNRLTVLAPSTAQPGLLATRAVLPNKEQPQPLGKPGEMLYATRYVDDRLYAVTFQKTDPLYSVDLSQPDAPRIRGALEIPGFSDYLHPLPNGLLIGVGLDARAAGSFSWFQGLQISLFDVNGNNPRELGKLLVGKRGSNSAALRNHHAFAELSNSGTSTFVIPGRVHEANGSTPANPPDNYYYPHAYSGLLRFAVEGDTPATARLRELRPLVTLRDDATYNPDDSIYNGRPVLFSHGAVYVDRGRFFWISTDGNTQSGPL